MLTGSTTGRESQSEMVLTPRDFNTNESKQDINAFKSSVSTDINNITPCFQHTLLGTKTRDILKKYTPYPLHDITEQTKLDALEAVQFHPLRADTLVTNNKELKTALKNKLPKKLGQTLGYYVNHIYCLAYQAICEEGGEIQPWVYLYFGHENINTSENYDTLNFRDHLIIAAATTINEMQKNPSYPNLCELLDKIFETQSCVIKECRDKLNELKTIIDTGNINKCNRQAMRTVYQASENAFTHALKYARYDDIAIISLAAQKTIDITQEPNKSNIIEIDKICHKAPGHSQPVKKVLGALLVLAGIVTIGLCVAGIPLTGGCSMVAAAGITTLITNYLLGSLAALSGCALLYQGQRKGYSNALFKFSHQITQANQSNILYDDRESIGHRFQSHDHN